MKYRMTICAAAIALAMAGCSAGKITVPRYVLSYGVSDYADDEDLNTPAYDAQSMTSLLVSCGFEERQTRTNSSVTKISIRDDIRALSSLDSDSIIVFFYSSHGTYSPAPGYKGSFLVPWDAINSDGTGNLANLISPIELSSWISQSGKKNVIVILNTCFSGGFVDPGSSIDGAPQNYGPNDGGTTKAGVFAALGKFGELLYRNSSDSGEPGPIVISAAGSEEVSYELIPPSSEIFDNHGIFPYFIITAAEKGDANGDGFVTATEAYVYAVNGIKIHWNLYEQNSYDSVTDSYADFMPHISGGGRDLVLFSN